LDIPWSSEQFLGAFQGQGEIIGITGRVFPKRIAGDHSRSDEFLKFLPEISEDLELEKGFIMMNPVQNQVL
jgi:hypothetical protein